ncbi:uncharacterized protein LOC114249977 [Bombyx mandarina]|uniref:Uncharacterized protein LOC114249977 n=1 Tax=Bombyx mandarina TaxID=7092 RepID=A0A6J2KCY8_BOMMA|nr:uncharacterized protein LOC114249977 [Bombyx mandarina]
MIIFMVLLIFIKVIDGNVGSILFYNRGTRDECWSKEDLAKLEARKTFEDLMPLVVQPVEINSKYINDNLRYFRKAIKYVDNEVEPYRARILKQSLFDTIGAHLRSEILPSIRFAYYAGYIPYRKARQMEEFFKEMKSYLNTGGLGWKEPERNIPWTNFTVSKLIVGPGKFSDSCSSLVTKRDTNSCIHLPNPKFDNSISPTTIALPFKSGGLLNLASPNSENALLKYYATASRCILKKSPRKCRHSDFVAFNNEMWHWMKRNVAPHLVDETLYAAYGGVLRIAAAVQSYGKGLSRRNLFNTREHSLIKWHPWKALTQSCKRANSNWTPSFYIGIVLMIAFGICVLQICYTYILGHKSACRCRSSPVGHSSKDLAYTNIESSIPAILPDVNPVFYNEQKRMKRSNSGTKSGNGSINVQKVYDLNENTERLMNVEVSDTESEVSSSSHDEDATNRSKKKVITPISPPKLDTTVSEVRIGKTRSDPKDYNFKYSTSTLSRSDTYFQGCDDGVESCSDSESSDSSDSGTSILSQSRSRRMSWSRDPMSLRGTSTDSYHGSSSLTLNANSYIRPSPQKQ